ncbi:hypothetical protein C1646_666562 [Rhizophagus diaphanus]|nr:hypothetical protein C1646_666562 [Rhizophagus diaphanus] [Rhizophagus sp. MUCL 43196]
MSTTDRANWSCERCTYVNEGIDLTCAMCFLTRTDAKDLPVQWEWRANPDQWIPYDLASSSELEDSYQRKKAAIVPKQDDNSILQPVAIEQVSSEDSCIICLDNFQDSSSVSPDQQVVKLPPCRGHYFHRSCVAAAIKLKDECPMCKKKLDY